jgi:hypothetical protein
MAEVGEQSLGSLTVSWLTKFLRNQLETNPVTFFPQLGAEELVAQKRLVVAEKAEFPMYDKVWFVGQTAGAPAFVAPFQYYGAPWARPKYWVSPGDMVHLAGMLGVSVASGAFATAFTLPPGFRPAEDEIFEGLGNDQAGGGERAIRVDVLASGVVRIIPALQLTAYVSLSGISFKAKPVK